MPRLQCPIEGCDWQAQDLDAAFAAGLTAALQIHDRTVHSTPAPAAPQKLKLDPPTISAGCDPDQWSEFTRQWDMYKIGMAITDNVLPTALFYCCKTDLRTDIMRDLRQDVATMAEADLLAAVKRLAVKDESILVPRIKLNKMTQSPGTGVRTFLANLRGQASLCQYKSTCKEAGCTHVFDYSDEIIKDNLVRGIADPEIMSDLLGDPKIDRTLEETVSFIAQKEQATKPQKLQSAIQLVPCVLCVQIQNSLWPQDADAGRAVVLLMDKRMIAKLGPDTVKLGHSHVVNVQQKDISPRTAASAPLVVSGATVTLHPELVSKVWLTRTHPMLVCPRAQPRTLNRTVQVMSLTNCVL